MRTYLLHPFQIRRQRSSEKRGSIVKAIDKLVASIVADEAGNKQASAASAAAFTQMQMQMQQMSFAMQRQMQEMQKFMR